MTSGSHPIQAPTAHPRTRPHAAAASCFDPLTIPPAKDDAARRRILQAVVPPVVARRCLEEMVNAVVTEIPLKLEPVTDDAFETDGPTEAEREIVLARIAALFGSQEPRRAILD